jgi:hypothetical protein
MERGERYRHPAAPAPAAGAAGGAGGHVGRSLAAGRLRWQRRRGNRGRRQADAEAVLPGPPAARGVSLIGKFGRSPAADPSLSVQMEDQSRLAFESGDAAFQINYPFIDPSQVVVRLDTASSAREGQPMELWFDTRKIYLFNPENGAHLTL